MRKLIILRGAPGSGKSSFVAKQGLEAYAVSSDNIRMLKSGVTMCSQGRIGINQNNDKRVWEEIEYLLEEKMLNGEFVILDAMHIHTRDFKMPLNLAKKHRYEVYCIDFSDTSIDVLLKRNEERIFYKQVPIDVIVNAHQSLKSSRIPNSIIVFEPHCFDDISLVQQLEVKVVDLNHYEKIHHIGDIQGCFEPIAQYFKDGFKDEEFYVFVGDFLDRGIQNGEVMRWLLNEVVGRENVVMIWGNHETHIHRYATDQSSLSREFENNTMPQLLKISFTKEDADHLCNKLVDCFLYQYNDINCIVTHGGISAMPYHIVLIPSIQFWKGTGTYNHPVDQTFSDNMDNTNWIQVHGHRNSKHLPIVAAAKSFNLECEVEFGGSLRIMTLNSKGYYYESIVNNTFRNQVRKTYEAPVNQSKISQALYEELESSKYIVRKKFESYPYITSYNFSRRVFQRNLWDNLTLTTRGLFIDDEHNIVARSYDKFFNIDERPNTKLDALKSTLIFPLDLYLKENGYLGILGYNTLDKQLFFASK